MKKSLFKFVAVGTIVSATIYSCQKDIKYDMQTKNSTPNYRSTAAIGNDNTYTEDQINSFISDIKSYHTDQTQTKWIGTTDAIGLMEASLNYIYSDIDTPFAKVITDTSFTFNFTNINEGQYNMVDIANKMYDIKAVILTQLSTSLSPGTDTRIMLGAIDYKRSGAGYMLTLYIGAASAAKISTVIPTYGTIIGDHEWGTGNKGIVFTSAYSCDYNTPTGTSYLLEQYGGTYLQDLMNYQISTHGYSAYVTGSPVTVYFSGGRNTLSVNGNTWLHPSDVTGIPTTDFPTTLLLPNGPTPSVFFTKINDISVIPIYNYNMSVNTYNWCIPVDYINYYLSKVNDIFQALKPLPNAVPLGNNNNIDNNSLTDYIVREDFPQNCITDIHHIIQYHYTTVKSRTTINPNWY